MKGLLGTHPGSNAQKAFDHRELGCPIPHHDKLQATYPRRQNIVVDLLPYPFCPSQTSICQGIISAAGELEAYKSQPYPSHAQEAKALSIGFQNHFRYSEKLESRYTRAICTSIKSLFASSFL